MNRTRSHAAKAPESAEAAAWRRMALQNWDGEGGSEALPPVAAIPSTSPEVAQLRMRVVALEGIVLALLAHGSGPQRRAAADMAAHIRPRVGRTPHPLTLRAATRITQLVARAFALRFAMPSPDREAGGRTPP